MSDSAISTRGIDQTELELARSKDVDHAHAHVTTPGGSLRIALTSGWHFTRHLLEMVAAMLVGMMLFSLATMLLGSPPGDDTLLGGYAYMGIAMTIPMAAWMRFRGHGWADCGEMSAAMLVPFFALVLPVALGLEIIPGLNPQTLMVPAHGAMIGGMVLLMVYRWDRYAHCHTAAAPVAAGARPASATDPVCGMPVDPTTARTTEHEGQTYRFCSPGCQQSFAQDPARYLAS